MMGLKKLSFSFLIICTQLTALGQEEFFTPSKFITRFPFVQLSGGVILLQARFDSHPDTLNFILDTGSGGISLDSTTSEYLGVKPILSDRTIRGIAGIKKLSFFK